MSDQMPVGGELPQDAQEAEPIAPYHEMHDVHIRSVVAWGVVLAVGIGVSLLLMGSLYVRLARHTADVDRRIDPVFPRAAPPTPWLHTDPRTKRQQLTEREDRLLATYGWVDRDDGIARIPVDEAMEILLERGSISPTERREQPMPDVEVPESLEL